MRGYASHSRSSTSVKPEVMPPVIASAMARAVWRMVVVRRLGFIFESFMYYVRLAAAPEVGRTLGSMRKPRYQRRVLEIWTVRA